MNAIGRRCRRGCATWPDAEEYSICPVCEEGTRRFRGMTPLTDAEAESRRKHADFDRFYLYEWVSDLTPLEDEDLAGLS